MLFECYKNNNFENFINIYLKFNKQVNLPPNLIHLTHLTYLTYLTHLTFGSCFNQQVNLPFSVKFLELNSNNVNIINYLPYSIEELVLECGLNLNLELNNLTSYKKTYY